MIMTVLERIESLRTRNQNNIKAVNKDLYKLINSKELLTIIKHNLPNIDFINLNNKLRLKQISYKENIEEKTMALILEAIYEPTLSVYKNSFQKGSCCHNSLKKIKHQWKKSKWVIESDFNNYSENINPHILIKILRKKIHDEKFLQILWKLFQSYKESTKISYKSKLGISKHSKLYTILIQIYLNEFDIFLEELRLKKNSQSLIKNKNIKNELKDPYSNRKGESRCKTLTFIRYDTKILIGIRAKKKLVIDLKNIIKLYLNFYIKLSSFTKKIKISWLAKRKTQFLGYLIETCNTKSPKIKKEDQKSELNLFVPTNKIIWELANKNFCTKLGKGISKKSWILYSDNLIITSYNTILFRLKNYYVPANNYRESIKRISHLMKFSCAHTLARKHRSKITSQLQKVHNDTLHSTLDINPSRRVFNTGTKPIETIFKSFSKKSKPAYYKDKVCVMCNSTKHLEISHIKNGDRDIRLMKSKDKHILMEKITNKQLCICKNCQVNSHKRRDY